MRRWCDLNFLGPLQMHDSFCKHCWRHSGFAWAATRLAGQATMFYNSLQLTTIECNTIHLGDFRIFSRIISFLQNQLGLSISKLHLLLVEHMISTYH